MKKKKEKKLQKVTVIGEKIQSDVDDFRKEWLKKGFELIDITQLCEVKLCNSGWCNELNQPDEKIYHIQLHYRNEHIGTFHGNGCYVIDDDKYVIFLTNINDVTGADFIMFKLCLIIKEKPILRTSDKK